MTETKPCQRATVEGNTAVLEKYGQRNLVDFTLEVAGCRGGNQSVEGCWWFPYLRIKKFWWFPYLKIEKLPNVNIMFFDRCETHIQDFYILFMHLYHFPILSFTKYNIQMRYATFPKSKRKEQCTRLSFVQKNLITRYENLIFCQDAPILFLYLLKHFGNS